MPFLSLFFYFGCTWLENTASYSLLPNPGFSLSSKVNMIFQVDLAIFVAKIEDEEISIQLVNM